MLSYRHAFHAGNHADVLKHCVLAHLLRHLAKKEKSFWCVDTHAGAALYDLRGEWARKNAEFASGIGRLWAREDLPPALADYRDVVRAANPGDSLAVYPGSAWIAERLLRRHDRLRLFELHGNEYRLLARHFKGAAPRVIAGEGDGFEALLALLPPPPRRGVVLIDPSYEDKNDYRRALAALRAALERFATGTYALWYPQVVRREARELPASLARIRPAGWLHASLTVKAPPQDGLGLYGSGLWVMNPPYTLVDALGSVLPYLARVLAQDGGATFSLDNRTA